MGFNSGFKGLIHSWLIRGNAYIEKKKTILATVLWQLRWHQTYKCTNATFWITSLPVIYGSIFIPLRPSLATRRVFYCWVVAYIGVLNEKGRVHLEENSYKQKLQMREGEGKKEEKREKKKSESEEKMRREMTEVSK